MTAIRRCQRATATAILALAVAAPTLGAEPPEPGDSSDDAAPRAPVRRIAASFNFEEEDNPYPVPRHWVWGQDTAKVPRPGFPRFNQSEFDFKVAHSGTASVRLATRGGSTSLRLGSGVIPVFAEGDYAVTAWVRTDAIQHSRAFMCARLLDQNSQPIPGTEVRTEPQETGGEWTEVAIQLIGAPARAAYLQVELQLLQPRQFESSGARHGAKDDAHRVWNEDLAGAAWFDDVVVYQLPRVEITTGAGANIVLMPSRPTVQILVRDFVGESLDGHIVVTDMDDRVIQDIRTPLATAGRPQEWVPTLPAFGWYRVALSVLGEKPDGSKYRVGGAEMSVVWLGLSSRHHDVARSDRARFGIVADRIEEDLRSALSAVGRTIGTGFTSIPLWHEGIARDEVAAAVPAIGRTIDELSQAGQQVIVSIPFIPGEILTEYQVDPANSLALADIDASKWMPFLQPVLDRYGQRLTRWQIGRAGIDGAFWHPDVVAAADKLGAQLATLVPGPRVAIPWRAEFSLPPGVPGVRADAATGTARGIGTLVMSYPAQFEASSIRSFVQEMIPRLTTSPGAAPAELVIVPELPPADMFGERAAVTELARRTIEFWAARSAPANANLPLSLAISHPWRRLGEHRAQLMPAASLGALRGLIEHLNGRQIVGEYRVAPGVKCYILADIRDTTEGGVSAGQTPRTGWTGALVAWNETAAPDDAVIRRFLGDGAVEVVDVFGNRTKVERTGEPGSPHAVTIGETPVFIEGADPMLAMFCSELKADPTFLPAVQTEHDMSLVLTNPWPQAISGKLQIVPPESTSAKGEARRRWSITPDAIIQFSLGAGQTKRIPWSVAFPYFEETGEKKFSVVVRLATDRELPPIVIPLSLQVGLQDLAIEPEVQLGPRLDGPDVIITASVSNRGQRSRMLKLEAVANGIPTHQTLIADLPPGEVVIKRIVLKNAAAQLSGRRVHLSLSDTEDQERLNTSVRVP